MGRFRRSTLHFLLGAAVVLATVFGGGVAVAASRVVASEAEIDLEVTSEEVLTAATPRSKSPRRSADEYPGPFVLPVGGYSHPTDAPPIADRRDAPPTRFLPASPGVLLLLCHFRC